MSHVELWEKPKSERTPKEIVQQHVSIIVHDTSRKVSDVLFIYCFCISSLYLFLVPLYGVRKRDTLKPRTHTHHGRQRASFQSIPPFHYISTGINFLFLNGEK